MSDGNSAVLGSKYQELTCETAYHHKIRHLDLNNRQFIHYYNGHEKQVTSISLNHHHNCILSSSLDQTVRLWDNRLNCDIPAGDRSSLGTIRIPAAGIPFANFDPMGIIFAVGINRDSIRLYDIRNFGKGPFKVKLYKDYDDKEKDWKQLVFSPDGQKIAISTNGTKMRIIDAFSLEKISSLTGFSNELNIHLELSWTTDSRSLFCGSSMNFLNLFGSKQLPLYLFNIIDGSIIQKYNSNHHAPIQCVKFNPKYYILASACHDVSFWQPPIQSQRIIRTKRNEIDKNVNMFVSFVQ